MSPTYFCVETCVVCVAKQLTPRTLDLEVWGSSPAHHVVSLDKELYSTLFLFTHVYKWVPATYCWGVTLRWTIIPSRGRVAILLGLLHATETGISSGRVDPGSCAPLPFYICLRVREVVLSRESPLTGHQTPHYVYSCTWKGIIFLYLCGGMINSSKLYSVNISLRLCSKHFCSAITQLETLAVQALFLLPSQKVAISSVCQLCRLSRVQCWREHDIVEEKEISADIRS